MQWYRKRALTRFVIFPLILLLMFSPLYFYTLSHLRQYTKQYNEKLLEQGLMEVEHEVRQLMRLGEMLYSDDSIFPLTHMRLSSDVPGTSDAYRISKAQNAFSSISTMDLQLTKYCGILFSGGIVLHGSKTCLSEKEYYGNVLAAEGCTTYDQWKRSISRNGRLYNLQQMRLGIEGIWDNYLVFSMSLPINGMWNTVFYAVIPLGSITKTLIFDNPNDQITLRLYDNYGLLYENGQTSSNAVCVSASGTEGILHADLYIPHSIYAKNVVHYGWFAAGVCIVFAIVGLSLSWFFTVKSTKNWENAINAIDTAVDTWNMQADTLNDGSNFISNFLQKVDERMKSDNLSLAQQENLIRKSLMDSILWNASASSVSEEVMHQYFPDFPIRYRLCIIHCPDVSIEDQTSFSRYQLQLTHIVSDLLPETSVTHFAETQLTIIQPFEADDYIQSRYMTISKSIRQSLGLESAIVIDESCTGIENVSRCFARVQCHIYASTGNVVLLHERIKPDDNKCLRCNEPAFQQAIIKGDKEKARAMLDQSAENLSQLHLSDPGNVQQIYYSYRAVLLQLISSSSSECIPAPYDDKKTVNDNFRELKLCIDEIDNRLQEEYQKNADLHDRMIIEWLDKHVYDVDLSINMAMDELSVSSRSLQSAVHQQTGMSFREYVIERRIEKAKHLLTETQLSVNEISEQCGYAYVNSFYKSFKKACMISPNELRATALRNKEE